MNYVEEKKDRTGFGLFFPKLRGLVLANSRSYMPFRVLKRLRHT